MTLNQTIQQLKEIAENHSQINSFYYGEPVDWATLNLVYPGLLLTQGPVKIVSGGVEIDFSIYLADLVFQTAEDVNDTSLHANTIEVQSDMLSVVNDLAANIENQDYDWILRSDLNCELYDLVPINEDMVAGVKADFTLFIPMAKDRCAVPHRSGNFLLTEGGLEIRTEDGSSLSPEEPL